MFIRIVFALGKFKIIRHRYLSITSLTVFVIMWSDILNTSFHSFSANIQLLSFFHQLLLSPSFNNLVIFFENSSVDTLSILTHSLQIHPNHNVVLINVDQQIHDISLLEPLFTHSIVIELYYDHDSHKLGRLRWTIRGFKVSSKWIRIYPNTKKMPRFADENRNTVIVKIFESSIHVEAFNFNVSKVIEINVTRDDDQIFKEMFFDWTLDYKGARLYIKGGMDVPNQFNARSFVFGHEVHGLSGIYAYISRVIGQYFNASVVFGFPQQDLWMESNPYIGYKQLKNRVYQTSFVVPQVEKVK